MCRAHEWARFFAKQKKTTCVGTYTYPAQLIYPTVKNIPEYVSRVLVYVKLLTLFILVKHIPCYCSEFYAVSFSYAKNPDAFR